MKALLLFLLLAACEPSVNHVNVPCDAIHPVDPKYGQDVCPRGEVTALTRRQC